MRVLLIGLDCAPPALVFDRFADVMPNLATLRARGISGPLRSVMPPITVPAWTCMLSGRDPGELGIYGFRNRARDRGYGLSMASAKDVGVKRVWDRLGEHGHRVASLFVPPSHPPTPLRGSMASCFLTPPGAAWTFPPSKAREWESRFGDYRSDVASFRDGDLARIFDELHAMTEQHFALARHVWTEEKPSFLAMVEMGPDRLHHAAWDHLDPSSPRHVPGNPWLERGRAYYAALDRELGRLLDVASDAVVIVASDHGARACEGAFAVNELLRREGWLATTARPSTPTPLREVVDWSRTRAWAEGGYYARLFLNVAGREPSGTIPERAAEAAAEELRALLLAYGPPGTKVWRPRELYGEVKGVAPDLLAVFGDLAWRSVGTLGHDEVRLTTLPRGVDGANHDWNGVVVMSGGPFVRGEVEASIFDVGRTVLGLFGIEPGTWRGRDWSVS
ncbi:MAG: alkaline phosphatase family protein [Sandaracinus sp.]|nr:alkaline phosphatase family protein [Sandaracinus sp.]MCB9623646.1 alkaline phosphatase family protein [Sandaracinus sp.]MCB9630700.1 alkaline phosphatase family protein [Sandaracinus sp.]